ncbi:MAG: hypothetical protein KA298_05585, partial [Paludibacteraceae bacterium]|nr:hypothetical protein [Paludibacteraceae bacterium]
GMYYHTMTTDKLTDAFLRCEQLIRQIPLALYFAEPLTSSLLHSPSVQEQNQSASRILPGI